ncbi:MAG: T9SS type A sorting domain-containing protein, partial [Bacteroidota bacterium]
WNTGVGVGFSPPRKNQDKEWIAADMTNSPYRHNLYMTWTEFDRYGSASTADSTRILCSRSTDAGATWSTPVRVSDRSGDCIDSDNTVEGAVPAIGPNGEVYTAWSGPLGIMFDKSTDGGVTWGGDIFVSDQPGGWDFDIPGINRCNGLPITACDMSNSPHRGNIYVNWSDQRNGAINTDIFLAKSTDGGATWSPATRVNDDMIAAQQFFTWMTIDQTTGYLYFVFYDRRNTSGNATDVFVARSTDGGETFTNFKVSQASFAPTSGVFFGDYTNIAAYRGKIYPIWMRLDGSILSVWTAIINDSVTVGVPREEGHASSFALHQNYPNPFNPSTMIRFNVPLRERITLKVFDVLGREIAILVDAYMDPGEHTVAFSGWDYGLASGTYFYRMTAGGFTETKRLILLQ